MTPARVGGINTRHEALELVRNVPVLEAVPEIETIVSVYLRLQLMPRGDKGDAAHLAIASHYAVDFLLTWNCRHLANVNKMQRLREVNNDLGLYVPKIATPDQLFREEVEDVQG